MMGENGIYLGFFWIFLGKNDFLIYLGKIFSLIMEKDDLSQKSNLNHENSNNHLEN